MARVPQLTNYEKIAKRVSPTPARPIRLGPGPGARSAYRESLWAYIEWLEERLAFAYDQREELFNQAGRDKLAHEATWNRWRTAYDQLKAIDTILHPPEDTDNGKDAGPER